MSAIDKIEEFNKFGSILGLERMSVLMELLGNPQEALKCIHVAGTNGKGSCCRYIYEALLANGYRVGFYTSPFIEVFNERIQLDGSYISDADLEKYTAIVLETVEKMIEMGYDSPTEFEVITAVAFVYFKEAGADFAVLEVGLGGRGDSTNIIKKPLVSIITSISLDHTDRLGDTIEQIAAEKSGIIKPGVPVISNVSDVAAARVIAGEAYRQGCLFTDASRIKPKHVSEHLGGAAVDIEIMGTDYSGIEISMTGEHQISNLTAALAAIELLRKQRIIRINRSDLYRGLRQAVQIGRFEIISENPYIILDGAHNEAGAGALADTMSKYFDRDRVLMVCGILADKDIDGILDNFTRIAGSFIVCEPVSERRLAAAELRSRILERECDCIAAASPEEAVRMAQQAKSSYDAVLYAGSLYLIGEIRRILGNECNETKKGTDVL